MRQCRLDKNKSFSIFVAIKSIDSSSTYTLKYQNQMRGNQLLGRRERLISVGLTQEEVILHIRGFPIHPLEFNLHTKISKTDSRQSIIGKACKSHQCRLEKNNSFSIVVAIKSIDSCSSYTLKY